MAKYRKAMVPKPNSHSPSVTLFRIHMVQSDFIITTSDVKGCSVKREWTIYGIPSSRGYERTRTHAR
jgi:hypothetical protein